MIFNKYAFFNQVGLLIIIVGIFALIAAIPVMHNVRRIVYKVMCNYYQSPPKWSIVRMFNEYADTFDVHLVQTLEYNTPTYLVDFLKIKTNLHSPIAKVLDLGCGTGLLGQALKQQFTIQQLTGIDFSENMIAKSQAKNIYNSLHNAELLEYLEKDHNTYDLITATDVFIYVGDIKAVTLQVKKLLRPGGYFAFSVESLPYGTFKLTPSGRFQHSIKYLQNLANDAGLQNLQWRTIPLRKEHGVMMQGYLIIMQNDLGKLVT